MINKQWVYKETPIEDIRKICEDAGISELLAKILLSRGIADLNHIKKFLNPSLEYLHDPFLMKDMGKAVDRVILAIKEKEKIFIYGDYDVDGITSTSILYNFLLRQNANVEYYIPDRIDEGYGLSINAIEKIRVLGAKLIITVDCGITAVEEVKFINDSQMEVIVTDHHECKAEIPEAYAVISPGRPDCGYPFKELAGVGVVYKLVCGLCLKMDLGDIHKEYLDLVALGTVADVVSLVDENRIIVKHGIMKIENTSNIGLKAIIDSCDLKDKPITSWVISFLIAPRINAAGRIGNAGRAVKLFTIADKDEAASIVVQLNDENKFRQDTEAEILRQAIAKIETEIDLSKEKVIIVAEEGWHHGVVGIVASKITEKYYRPCILISSEDGIGKGSGRSISGFDLFKALSHCQNLLKKFGGHELAAGLSLKMENISELRRMINSYADVIMDVNDLIPKVKIDVHVNKHDISIANIKQLERLAPFGAGNPGPVFGYDNLKISEIRTVGENKHLKLKLEDSGFGVDAIGFNMGNLMGVYSNSDLIDAACSIEINSWNSIDRIQLNLKDIKHNDETAMEDEYFYSFEKCIGPYNNSNKDCLGKNYIETIDEINILNKVSDAIKIGKKTAILVNSLEYAKKLEKMLRKCASGIKNIYKICYTSSSVGEIYIISVIINPDPDEIDFDKFEMVMLYGGWINKTYLNNLLNKINNKKQCFCCGQKESQFNSENFVPERSDLIAVYQYIKANSRDNKLVDDMFILAKKIARSYKINMNYFKFKKSIEIFGELKLLKNEKREDSKISLELINSSGKKTNIENSKLYRRLQQLKSEIKEA